MREDFCWKHRMKREWNSSGVYRELACPKCEKEYDMPEARRQRNREAAARKKRNRAKFLARQAHS